MINGLWYLAFTFMFYSRYAIDQIYKVGMWAASRVLDTAR